MKPSMPNFDMHAMRLGLYADKYFLRTQEILMKDNYDHSVHYQYFPRKDIVICGIDHVLGIFKKCTGYYKDVEKARKLYYEIKSMDLDMMGPEEHEWYSYCIFQLNELWVDKFNEISFSSVLEGSNVNNMEPCIGIIGNPKYFAHLETPTLGILAQQSAVATSVREVCNLLNPNQKLLFFPARFRHYLSQAPDGYASYIGGAHAFSTDSNGEYLGLPGVGTIPHLLIAAYEGNTALAALKFNEMIDPDIDRTILVDWDNNVIKSTLEVILALFCRLNRTIFSEDNFRNLCNDVKNLSLETLIEKCKAAINIHKVIGKGKDKIFGVRFDTSGSLIDENVPKSSMNFGVCPELVFNARKTFDELGLNDLKIIVSGGFDLEKVKVFQAIKAPVDMYGIGSSIVNKFHVDFTADAVMLDGKPNAKVGRELKDWSKLIKYRD